MSLDAGTRAAPTPLRAVVAEVTKFDRQAFAPVAGLRVAVGVSAALTIGLAAGSPTAAASLAAGALLVGLPTAVGGRRIGIPGLALIALTMAVSTFVGSATGEIGWLHTAILVPWCLAGGLLLALPNPFTAAGTQGIAAMIVFGRFAAAPLGALRLAGYVLAGGAIAIVVLALTRSPLNSRVQRRALAAAAVSLAALARAGPGRRNGVASAESLAESEVLLLRGLGRSGADELRALLDVARRARLELLAIDGLQRRLVRLEAAGAGPAGAVRDIVEEALAVAADALDAISRTVVTGEAATTAAATLDETVRATRARLRALGPTGAVAPVARALEDHLAALAAQLRAAADLADPASPHRRSAPETPWAPSWREGLREGLDTLRSQATLRAPVGRHAVRLAVVVTAAEVIAQRTPLGRGYWVPLTASVVLRPEFGNTFSRGLARLAGTCGGVLLAGLLAVAVHPDGASGVIAIGLLCLAAGASFQVSYALFSGFLTGAVVLLVGVVGPATLSTALDRLADTAIGGAIALTAYALWPTWSRATASAALATLTRAQRDYLGTVLAVLAGRHPRDLAELRRLARAAREGRGNAESAVDAGPHRTSRLRDRHRPGPGRAGGARAHQPHHPRPALGHRSRAPAPALSGDHPLRHRRRRRPRDDRRRHRRDPRPRGVRPPRRPHRRPSGGRPRPSRPAAAAPAPRGSRGAPRRRPRRATPARRPRRARRRHRHAGGDRRGAHARAVGLNDATTRLIAPVPFVVWTVLGRAGPPAPICDRPGPG